MELEAITKLLQIRQNDPIIVSMRDPTAVTNPANPLLDSQIAKLLDEIATLASKLYPSTTY